MYRRLCIGAVHGLVAAWSAMSAAEPAVVVASTLFQQAVAKMEEEQFSEACPLLDQSYRLDAKSGTLFTLANCRDHEGKVASAHARYGEYLRAYAAMTDAEQRKHANRATLAETRMRELGPQLPTLKLTWQGALPAGVKIRVDDVELAGHALSVPLPLDPGPHEITVKQAGAPDTKRVVTLELNHSTRFDLDVEVSFVKPPEEPPPILTPVKAAPPPQPRTNPRKSAGFITLGLGGASLVFGGVMGALALTEKQTVDAHCTGAAGNECDAVGFSAVEKMRTYTTPSTAGFIAGGVLAVTGMVLVLSAPAQSKEKPTTMTLRTGGVPGGGLVGIQGEF